MAWPSAKPYEERARDRGGEHDRHRSARTEAVEHHAHRNLRGGEGQEEGAGQEPEGFRRQPELGAQGLRDNGVRRAKELAQDEDRAEASDDRDQRMRKRGGQIAGPGAPETAKRQ